jgi:hypothetical protein
MHMISIGRRRLKPLQYRSRFRVASFFVHRLSQLIMRLMCVYWPPQARPQSLTCVSCVCVGSDGHGLGVGARAILAVGCSADFDKTGRAA